MRRKTFLLIFISLMLQQYNLLAQETIPVSGGSVLGTGGSGYYSVGQMVFSDIVGKNGNVLHGIQQPYEIIIEKHVDPSFQISLNCSVYPNPTADFVILKIDNDKYNQLSYEIIDINGKTLTQNNIENRETKIDFKEYILASYLLKVKHFNKEVVTYKIVKINQ
jgi:hypothetical protein